MTTSRRMQQAASGRVVSNVAITHIGSSIATTSFGTSIAISPPSGYQAGDVAFLMHSHSSGIPGTWNSIASAPGGLMWKAYSASESSITITAGSNTQMIAVISVYRNVHNTTPIDAQSTVKSTASGTSLTSNTATAVHARTMLMSVCRCYVASGSPSLTKPSELNLSRQGTPQITAFGIAYTTTGSGPAAGAAMGATAWTTSVATYDSVVQNFLLRPYDT